MHPRLIVISVVMVACASVAAAAPSAPTSIVVESYDGARPADAAVVLAPVTGELSKRGFLVGDALVAAVDANASRDAGELTASQSADAEKLVARGFDSFINGDYQKALDAEQQALALYASAPATLAKEPALRDLQFKAELVAARSSEVLGDGESAFRVMAEAMRTIPDRPVNPAEFDPSVKALYKRVKDELVKQGVGVLEIKVDDATAVIFVDERFVGTGTVTLDGLLPGRYRVYVAKGETRGRVREVDVPAHGHATVDVPWSLDSVLRTRTAYVGLESERSDGEINAALGLARALAATRVVVLGIRTVEGRRSIVAWSISTETRNKVFGAVQLEPITPPAPTLVKLASLLAGDKIDAAGIITTEPAPVETRRVIGQRASALHKVKWFFCASALVALGTGGALIAIDNEPTAGTARVKEYNNTKSVGIGVAAGGAALAAIAIYMFVADHPVDIETEVAPGVTLTPTASPDQIGFALSGRF